MFKKYLVLALVLSAGISTVRAMDNDIYGDCFGSPQEMYFPKKSPQTPNKHAPLNNNLLSAAKAGSFGEIKKLLEAGAEIDYAKNSDGNTALHLAVTIGDEYSVETLLEFNPNLTIKNNAGFTAYDLAVRQCLPNRINRTNKPIVKKCTNHENIRQMLNNYRVRFQKTDAETDSITTPYPSDDESIE
jgi:ankyrin repeat protein